MTARAVSLLRSLSRGCTEEADLRKLFNFVDVNRNGAVERSELAVLLGAQSRLSREQIDRLLGGRESVDWPAFVEALRRHSELVSSVRSAYSVYFVTGGPASGKGTICGALTLRRDDLVHISSGELLRAEVARATELGQHVGQLMREGQLVSAAVVLALLDAALARDAPGKRVLLDGFPRSLANAQDFYAQFGPALGLLMFDVPEEEMVRRIVERGRTSGRADDTEQTARKRIAVFREQSEAPTQYLLNRGVPLIRVDAMRPIDENVRMLADRL